MKGIIGVEEPQGVAPGGQTDPGGIPPMEELEALGISKEMYPMLEQFVGQGMELIWGEGRESTFQQMEQTSLADTMTPIISRITSQGEWPDMVKFIGGAVLLNQLAELAEAMGKEIDENERMRALSETLADQVAKGIESGEYDPEELRQAGMEGAQKLGLDTKEML